MSSSAGSSARRVSRSRLTPPTQTTHDDSSDDADSDSTDEMTLIFRAAPTPKPVNRAKRRRRTTDRVARRETGDFILPLQQSSDVSPEPVSTRDNSEEEADRSGVHRLTRDGVLQGYSGTSEESSDGSEFELPKREEQQQHHTKPSTSRRTPSKSPSTSPIHSPTRFNPSSSSSSRRSLLWPAVGSSLVERVSAGASSANSDNSPPAKISARSRQSSSPEFEISKRPLFRPPSTESLASADEEDDDQQEEEEQEIEEEEEEQGEEEDDEKEDEPADEVVLAQSPISAPRPHPPSTPPPSRPPIRMTFSPVPPARDTLAFGRRAGRVSLTPAREMRPPPPPAPAPPVPAGTQQERLTALRERIRSLSPQIAFDHSSSRSPPPPALPELEPAQPQARSSSSATPPPHPQLETAATTSPPPHSTTPPPHHSSPPAEKTASPPPAREATTEIATLNATPRASTSTSSSSVRVIEISSTSPRAAAKAAAILKVYGDFIEQGLEPPGSLLRAAGLSASTSTNPYRTEQRLKGLLNTAERSVLRRSTSVLSSSAFAPSRTPDRAQGSKLRLTPTPTSSLPAQPGSGYRNEFPPTSSPVASSSALSSQISDGNWGRADWRQLEKCLVKSTRRARHERTQVKDEKVVERYLLEVGYAPGHEGEGDWSWNKLITRVRALQARRARESRQNSLLPVVLKPLASADEPAEEGRGGGGVLRSVKSEPREEDEQLTSDAGEESRAAEDDTFFHRQHTQLEPPAVEEEEEGEGEDDSEDDEARRERQPSVPLALATARFAHLFDDEPLEKPPLPKWALAELKAQRRANGEIVSSSEEEEEEVEEEDEATPEPIPIVAAVSSARKLVSWVGGFLGRGVRSPAPAPSSPAVHIAVQSSDATQEGEEEDEEFRHPMMRERSRSTSSSLSNVIAVASYSSSSSSATGSTPDPVFPQYAHLTHSDFLQPPQPDLPVASTSRIPIARNNSSTNTGSSSQRKIQDLSRPLPPSPRGAPNIVQSRIAALEEAESSREEDSRVMENLFGGGAEGRLKRKASLELSRLKSEETPGMVPAGARALDRPIGRVERRRS